MPFEAQKPQVSKPMYWTGVVIGLLPVPLLAMSAVAKFLQPDDVVKGFSHLGWPVNVALALGILETVCTIIYLIPQTAVLGAVLLTGYLGGAIATHVRIGEHRDIAIPVVLGLLIWGGLFLRDPRIRALLPLRK